MDLWAEPTGETLGPTTSHGTDCQLASPGELLNLSLPRLCPATVVFKDSPVFVSNG